MNNTTETGLTLLHLAVMQKSRLDLVKFIIERGSNINAADDKGMTVSIYFIIFFLKF